MAFLKLVPLYRSISFPICNIPARWVRLVCLVLLFAVVLYTLPIHPEYNVANAQSSHPRRTQGPPSHNLLDLDKTYANAESKAMLKENGYWSWPSPLTAQSNDVVSVIPGTYQIPTNLVGLTVTLPSNTGHGSTFTTSSAWATRGFYTYAARSAWWSAFQSVSGVITAGVALNAGNHLVKLRVLRGWQPRVALLSWTLMTVLTCLPDVPPIGAAPRTGGGEGVATTHSQRYPSDVVRKVLTREC